MPNPPARLPEPWSPTDAREAAQSAALDFGFRKSDVHGMKRLASGGTSRIFLLDQITDPVVLRVSPPNLGQQRLERTLDVLDYWQRAGADIALPFADRVGAELSVQPGGLVTAWKFAPDETPASWIDAADLLRRLRGMPLPDNINAQNWRWQPHAAVPARVARYLAAPQANSEWATYVMEQWTQWDSGFNRLLDKLVCQPNDLPIGVVHGDMGPHNVRKLGTFRLGDWDESGIGLQTYDDLNFINQGIGSTGNDDRSGVAKSIDSSAYKFANSIRLMGGKSDVGHIAWLMSVTAEEPNSPQADELPLFMQRALADPSRDADTGLHLLRTRPIPE